MRGPSPWSAPPGDLAKVGGSVLAKRGRPPVDVEALASVVSRFSVVSASVDRLGELEANPLIVSAAGVIAIDARGTLD